MSLNCFQEPISVALSEESVWCFIKRRHPKYLLMFRVVFFLVGREKCCNEESTPLRFQLAMVQQVHKKCELTVNDNVTNGISPIFLIFGFPVVCSKLSRPVSQNGVTLCEDLAIWHLQYGNIPSRIHFGDRPATLVFWPFVE